MADIELMCETLEAIEESYNQPSDQYPIWDQSIWMATNRTVACNTTACYAGWAVILRGWEPSYSSEDGYDMFTDCCVKDGAEYTIEYAAQQELELSDREASYLFNSSRTLDEIRRFVRHYADKKS